MFFFYAPLECVKLWAWNFFLNLICRSVLCVQFWTRGQTSAYNITCAGLERYCYYHWLELRPTWKLLSICHASHVGRLCTRQKYLFCGSPSQPLRWRVYSYCSAGVVKCFALGYKTLLWFRTVNTKELFYNKDWRFTLCGGIQHDYRDISVIWIPTVCFSSCVGEFFLFVLSEWFFKSE